MKTSLREMFAAALLVTAASVQAQWQTQTLTVQPGWSAVYLHVDASYDTLDDLVGSDAGNPIQEIWAWQPPSALVQYVTSPSSPITSANQWSAWERLGTGLTSTLARLAPNTAYLVHSTATSPFTWTVKGKPVAPNYNWSATGENFLGFPTPPGNPPMLDSFLQPAPSLEAVAQFFQYQGGDLSTNNPGQVFALHTTPVVRGQAFWLRAGNYYNSYFGPFTVVPQIGSGVNFGDSVSQYAFHLQNTSSGNVTVTLKLLPSEAPPAGQLAIVDVPPLLVRGAMTSSAMTYNYTNLVSGGSVSWTLPPQGQQGSDFVVTLGLNRYVLTNNPGALFAGILQLTDNAGLEEADLPVSANVASYAGLWVGKALVSQVGSYLKTYQRDVNNNPVIDANGAYVITSLNTNLGNVSTAFPLRLVVHNNGTSATLLERVYYGFDPNTNAIVTTREGALDPAQLSTARKITAGHLPWTPANTGYALSGQLTPGGLLSATVDLAYDDQSSNPFLHTYHPDHDNLDATFANELPVGSESYDISRVITLNVTPPGTDFGSLTQAGQNFSGAYTEAITMTGLGGATRTFNVAGSFSLVKISPISVLTP